MSKIYLVERLGYTEYDEYRAHVVVATSVEHAKELCKIKSADEDPKEWENVAIEMLSKNPLDDTPRIILSDFRAG